MHAQPKSPNRKLTPRASWYILGLMIFILGPIWAVSSLLSKANTSFPDEQKLNNVMNEVTINKAGDFTLYEHIAFGWPMLSITEDLLKEKSTAPTEHYKFKVYKPGGAALPIRTMNPKPWLKSEWGKNIDFYAARATVYLDEPGQYMIAIANPTDSSFVLSSASPESLYQHILLTLILFFACLIIGPLFILTTFFLRRSNLALLRSADYEIIQRRKAIAEYRVYAALIHSAGLFGYLFPLGHLIAPAVFYLMSANRYPSIKSNFYSVINFQITMTLLMILTIILLLSTGFFLGPIGLFFLLVFLALVFLHIALTLLGVVMSFKEGLFIYPLQWRFLKD